MKHLPVPPLPQSLGQYLTAIGPIVDGDQQRRATELVESFATTEGPACQEALVRFADEENAAGRSWLSRAWLSAYLSVRAPLPLSSNVGFRIRASTEATGSGRAADVIHRAAAVHLAHLRGEIEDEVSPRGNALDMSQWMVLAGGARRPRRTEDEFLQGPGGAENREIGVLWQGRLVMMPISDGAGRPRSRRAIGDALHRMQGLDLPEDDTFTHLSYLGSDTAAAYLDALMEHPGNIEMHERLVDAVFLVNLTNTPASPERHQERVTFHTGQAWVYKPFTYQVSLVDDFVGVHVEHSVVDGVILGSVVKLMQEVEPDDLEAASESAPLEVLTWSMTTPLREQLARDVVSYGQAAGHHHVRIVQFPVPVPADLTFPVSHDAIQQLVLLFAQVTTFGRARSVYEAVDMREFRAGRTECMRPVTPDALTLIEAMLSGTATREQLSAALATHREQVIACKTGQGFDRHLMALRLMAEDLDLRPPLFSDEAYRALTTDFLSTTSVGTAQRIVRFTFAPTTEDGLGVNYTTVDGMYEFCLTYRADRMHGIEAFTTALGAGVDAFSRLLTSMRDG